MEAASAHNNEFHPDPDRGHEHAEVKEERLRIFYFIIVVARGNLQHGGRADKQPGISTFTSGAY